MLRAPSARWRCAPSRPQLPHPPGLVYVRTKQRRLSGQVCRFLLRTSHFCFFLHSLRLFEPSHAYASARIGLFKPLVAAARDEWAVNKGK